MDKKNIQEINNLNTLTEGHILYFFKDLEAYKKNIIDFVYTGLNHNQHSLIIENERLTPLLQESLSMKLNESQMSKVRFINNYDFYFAKGDFGCNSIFDYLPSLFKEAGDLNFSVRSWAHVEWGDISDIHKKLSDAESEADIIVRREKLLSVCAYDSDRVSNVLKAKFLDHHNYIINN